MSMVSIYNLKPKFQQLLMPVLRFLHRLHVTANQITISAIVLSFLMGLAFWYADKNILLFWALPVGLLIRMALNALDGLMARTYNQQSKKGEVLNEIGDIISDVFIFFPLLKFESNNLYLIVIFICLGIINEFAGLLGKVVSNDRRYDGPMGKSDRAFMIGIYGILSYFGVMTNVIATYLFAAIILLLLVSTTLRIKNSLK